MPKLSQETKRAAAIRVVRGLRKHFARDKTYSLDGKTYSQADLIDAFQSHVAAMDAVNARRAELAAAVAEERAAGGRVRALQKSLKLVVGVNFGRSAVVYADFGWELPKAPGPKTVEAKLQGAARVRETRRLRGTLGRRQRKKIKGG